MCKKGAKCTFIHPWKPCAYFARGECKFGDKCTFLHVKTQSQSTPEMGKECPRNQSGEQCDDDKCEFKHSITINQLMVLKATPPKLSPEEKELIATKFKVDFDKMDILAIRMGCRIIDEPAGLRQQVEALGCICKPKGYTNFDVADSRDIQLFYVDDVESLKWKGSAKLYAKLARVVYNLDGIGPYWII